MFLLKIEIIFAAFFIKILTHFIILIKRGINNNNIIKWIHHKRRKNKAWVLFSIGNRTLR